MSYRAAPQFVRVGLESEDCPARLRAALGPAALKYLYVAGNPALLNREVVGLLASREVDPTSLLKAAQAFKDLIAAGVCIIGGWHSPLEATLLQVAEAAHARLGMLLATGSEHAVLPDRIMDRVQNSAGFVLTHCAPNVHRISRAGALRRNELVVVLSDALLVPLAPAGSATAGVAKRAILGGTLVLTTDAPANQHLLAAGALRFTAAALATAIAKSSPNRA